MYSTNPQVKESRKTMQFRDENDILYTRENRPEVDPAAIEFQVPERKSNITAAQARAAVNLLAALSPYLTVISWAAQMRGNSGIYFQGDLAADIFGNQPVHYVVKIETMTTIDGRKENVHDLGLVWNRIASKARENAIGSIVGVAQDAFGFFNLPAAEDGTPHPMTGKARISEDEALNNLQGAQAALAQICIGLQNRMIAEGSK